MKLNEIYTRANVIKQMQEFFSKEGFLQLVNLFDVTEMRETHLEFQKSNFKEIYKPLIMRRKELDSVFAVEILKLVEFFKSQEFKDYLEDLIEVDVELQELTITSYGHKDYIILNDQTPQEHCIDVIFDLTDNWSQEFGGVLTYTTKHEELLYLDPQFNALSVVFRDQGVMRYLKYINNKATKNSLFRIEMKWSYS